MTQNISNQSVRNLSFADLEQYVNDNIQGEQDKSVLNLNGEGSFKVSTTDSRYAFTRSNEDKDANLATRKAVMNALKGAGINLNNLSDDMKKAMKYGDFEMKHGEVTSTHPLSAMRLKAIVTQAQKELAEIKTQQLADRWENSYSLDGSGPKYSSEAFDAMLKLGNQNLYMANLNTNIGKLIQPKSIEDVQEGLDGVKSDLNKIMNRLAKNAEEMADIASVISSIHDEVARLSPELKGLSKFEKPFADFNKMYTEVNAKKFFEDPKNDVSQERTRDCFTLSGVINEILASPNYMIESDDQDEDLADMHNNADTLREKRNLEKQTLAQVNQNLVKILTSNNLSDTVEAFTRIQKDLAKLKESLAGLAEKTNDNSMSVLSNNMLSMMTLMYNEYAKLSTELYKLPLFNAIFAPYREEAVDIRNLTIPKLDITEIKNSDDIQGE